MYNVLSLFDGISCGRIALERAGVKFDSYFCSEIDKYSLECSKYHYSDNIFLGDVVNVRGSDLPKIDLLIGGSPCQGFSFAGKMLNFKDSRSMLFFEYVRLLKECNPKYFLLENVKMKKEFSDIISDILGVPFVEINSSLVSKQNRKRYYWTNIPIMPIVDKKIMFNKYVYRLAHGYIKDEISFREKYPTLTAQAPGSKYRIIEDLDSAFAFTPSEIRRNSSVTRQATPEECEEFQTLPIGYTSMLSKTRRYKVIGNCWTVDVIAHIFGGIKDGIMSEEI